MRIPSLALLRVQSFRWLGLATILNSVGMMGETVGLGWLTLQLTNSPFLVGVAMRTPSIPLFFIGMAYLAVAAGYLGGMLALLPASAPQETRARAPGSLWRGVVDFVSDVGRDRTLLVLMLLVAGAEILGFSHQALLPSLARDILHV